MSQLCVRRDMNIGTVDRLPSWSAGPGIDIGARIAAFRAIGIEGVQADDPSPYVRAGFIGVRSGRADLPREIGGILLQSIDMGAELTTLHLGTGLESDRELDAFAAAVIEQSARLDHPALVEVHRATITQDMRRTFDLVGRFPELRFNADLAHWHLGQEMPYGNYADKLSFLRCVFDRVRYVQMRLATSGAIQVPVDLLRFPEAITHWRALHVAVLQGFIRTAAPEERLPIAPELLPCVIDHAGAATRIDYAWGAGRDTDPETEQSDRWRDGERLLHMFEEFARQALPAVG